MHDFDRTEHCRRVGAKGGATTAARYGAHRMRELGKTGWKVCVERHGVGFCRGMTTAKGWQGRRAEQLQMDLMFGRLLAGSTE